VMGWRGRGIGRGMGLRFGGSIARRGRVHGRWWGRMSRRVGRCRSGALGGRCSLLGAGWRGFDGWWLYGLDGAAMATFGDIFVTCWWDGEVGMGWEGVSKD